MAPPDGGLGSKAIVAGELAPPTRHRPNEELLSLSCGAIKSAPSAPTATQAACFGHLDRGRSGRPRCFGPEQVAQIVLRPAGDRTGGATLSRGRSGDAS